MRMVTKDIGSLIGRQLGRLDHLGREIIGKVFGKLFVEEQPKRWPISTSGFENEQNLGMTGFVLSLQHHLGECMA